MPTNTMMPMQGLGCAPGALPGGLTRTRFYDGMFLTQADLENEQTYWRMKRRLTNRALGAGVVWGLRLTFDATARTYTLSPGYAIDCCGNDLIVECPMTVTEAELIARSQPLLGTNSFHNQSSYNPVNYCVILQYVECADSIRPVHRDACSPSGSACAPSRMRETCRLLLVPECADPRGCDGIQGFLTTVGNIRKQAAGGQVESASTPVTNGEKSAWFPTATYGGTEETAGAVLLAGIAGYLRTADAYQVDAQSRLAASYMMSTVTSALLGLDVNSLSQDQRDQLSTATDTLLSTLCQGMLYPGPRCRDEHHGVYLGCLRSVFSRNQLGGQVFDQWQCRREVLTGPLINWWLCQFGLLPIDVIMNRLTEAICESKATNTTTTTGTIETAVGLTGAADGMVTDSKTVEPLELYTAIARMMTSSNDGIGLVKLQATAPNGKPMSMIVPTAAAASSDIGSEVERLAQAQLVADKTVQPLSRGPLRDLVTELGARTPISAVASGVDADTVKALGSVTIASLLDTEPEAVLAKVGGAKPTDAQRGAINQLYLNAESFVRDATAAAAPTGKTGVSRAQLKGAELKTALKKVSGVSAAVLDAAVAAASKR